MLSCSPGLLPIASSKGPPLILHSSPDLSIFFSLQMHARVGEVEYMAATMSTGGSEAVSQKYAAESLKRFCRSIELCDDYLRGYYGLKLVR